MDTSKCVQCDSITDNTTHRCSNCIRDKRVIISKSQAKLKYKLTDEQLEAASDILHKETFTVHKTVGTVYLREQIHGLADKLSSNLSPTDPRRQAFLRQIPTTSPLIEMRAARNRKTERLQKIFEFVQEMMAKCGLKFTPELISLKIESHYTKSNVSTDFQIATSVLADLTTNPDPLDQKKVALGEWICNKYSEKHMHYIYKYPPHESTQIEQDMAKIEWHIAVDDYLEKNNIVKTKDVERIIASIQRQPIDTFITKLTSQLAQNSRVDELRELCRAKNISMYPNLDFCMDYIWGKISRDTMLDKFTKHVMQIDTEKRERANRKKEIDILLATHKYDTCTERCFDDYCGGCYTIIFDKYILGKLPYTDMVAALDAHYQKATVYIAHKQKAITLLREDGYERGDNYCGLKNIDKNDYVDNNLFDEYCKNRITYNELVDQWKILMETRQPIIARRTFIEAVLRDNGYVRHGRNFFNTRTNGYMRKPICQMIAGYIDGDIQLEPLKAALAHKKIRFPEEAVV